MLNEKGRNIRMKKFNNVIRNEESKITLFLYIIIIIII